MPDATPPSGPTRSATPVRAEIQALRAIAVLAVVLFHFWPLRVPGGYVGVDIFFAISGYLITSQLLREFDSTGRISLPRFWARRARRLLPASLLVLVATAIFIRTECPLVIGNVAAYYNTTHITETFAQTLGPYLRKQLAAAARP